MTAKTRIKWSKKIGLGLVTLFVILLITGLVFEQVSRTYADKIEPNGQFVNIDNHRLHFLKKGNHGPTVVFETAFDPAGHLQWYHIQQSLSKSYTTLSYDRAGILWSDRGENLKSGEKIAEELHQLLEKANVPKPYILVGHSFGGMLNRFFVDKYPQNVAGVILVDSQCPNDDNYLSPELHKMVNQGMPSSLLKVANTFGAARLMFKNMFPDSDTYKHQNSIMPALIHKSAYAVLEEQDEMSSIKKDASKINSFGTIPLYVISATDKNRFNLYFQDENLRKEMVDAWDTMQKDLLQLSTNSKHILVPNSSHYINQDKPEVIENAINDMINKLRLD